MKKMLLFLLLFAGMANAQIVNIPDAAFKAKLLGADVTNIIAMNAAGNPIKIDTNNDGEIQESEALNVYKLRVENSTILNLAGISSFTNLTSLDCSNNIIFNLDVSALTDLTILTCSGNYLTTLDISGLANLTQLFCDSNKLTSITGTSNLILLSASNNKFATLDLTGSPNLGLLTCNNNELTSLNVTGLSQLGVLTCSNNNLTSLNLAGVTNLQQLQCDHNQLTNLDLSQIANLTNLYCFYNQLTSLDLSNAPNLTNLSCGENSIATLNLDGLTHLSYLECSYLPNNLVINGANLNALTGFQYTGQNSVLTLNGFPNLNGINLTILQPTLTLNVSGLSNHTNIYLYNSQLTSLSVNGTGPTQMQSLNCPGNQLTALNLNGLENLSELNCSNNKLTSLNLTNLPGLMYLSCSGNKIPSLNLSATPNLKHLDCNNNKLMALDVSGLSMLEYLDCSNNASFDIVGNQITTLAVSGLTHLKYLDCSNYNFYGVLGAFGNQINSLDVNALTDMEQLKCVKNNIPSLVINGLTNLTDLDCSYNLLTSLDLIGLTNLVHLNYRHNQLSNLNMTGLVNITELDCSENNISTLTVTNMPNLTRFVCNQNTLTTLDLSGLNLITTLSCDNNLLTTLDVSNMPNLLSLSCHGNQLTNLDINNITSLAYLSCGSNLLTSLDVSDLVNLLSLSCSGNQITSLNVSSLAHLLDLTCDYNQLTTLDVNMLSSLRSLTCGNNLLTSLDISTLTHLESLDCRNNQLTSLTPVPSSSIISLSCASNQITSLDVSGLSNLDYLICNDNLLTELFMKNGHTEMVFDFADNPGLAYICADDAEVGNVQTALNTLSMTSTVCNSYCTFTPGGPHNSVIGTTIFDGNNNGCNINDPLHPNIRVDISDGTTTGSAFTNANGTCTFFTDAGNYTIFPNIENASAFNISPASASINFPDNNNNISNQSFCLSANGVLPDVEVVVTPIGPARPGFDAEYKIVYKNKGNQTLSGAVNLVFDDVKIDFVSAAPAEDTQAGNTLSWTYSNLLPFEDRSINLVFHVNSPVDTPPVNNGEILNFTASITPVSGDETPLDNGFILAQTTVGSFDPNAKTCLEGEAISSTQIGNYLHYNIEFENLGTAEAMNVVVRDVIDTTKFDISSLQVLYASHPMRATIRENAVEFVFENINLLAAQGNPPVGGHGNVLFKIKTLPTLSPGDQVENKADIFFDYNAPVATDPARTTFQMLSNPGFANDSIAIYPNPVKNNVNIKSVDIINTVELFDIQGRILRSAIINANTVNLDMTGQSNGIYFIRVTSDKGQKVQKLIKE